MFKLSILISSFTPVHTLYCIHLSHKEVFLSILNCIADCINLSLKEIKSFQYRIAFSDCRLQTCHQYPFPRSNNLQIKWEYKMYLFGIVVMVCSRKIILIKIVHTVHTLYCINLSQYRIAFSDCKLQIADFKSATDTVFLIPIIFKWNARTWAWGNGGLEKDGEEERAGKNPQKGRTRGVKKLVGWEDGKKSNEQEEKGEHLEDGKKTDWRRKINGEDWRKLTTHTLWLQQKFWVVCCTVS